MPYYNFVSRGWKLPSPDRCSLSLASPAQPGRHIYHQCSLSLASKAQPGRDIYHLRTSVHSAWPAQRSLEGTFTTSGLFTQNGQPSPDCSVRAALPGSAKPSQPGQASLACNLKLARKARSLLRLGWKSKISKYSMKNCGFGTKGPENTVFHLVFWYFWV